MAHREHETSQPYSDNILTSYSYRHAPLHEHKQLEEGKEKEEEHHHEHEHNNEPNTADKEEEDKYKQLEEFEEPNKSKSENKPAARHECSSLSTNSRSDKSNCFVDYLSPAQTTRSSSLSPSSSVETESKDAQRKEFSLDTNREHAEKPQLMKNVISSSKAKWIHGQFGTDNLRNTSSVPLEAKDDYINEVSNVSSLTNTADPLAHLPVLMSVDKSTETSIRSPHEITIPTAGATSHRVGPDYVPLEEMLSVEMIEHLTACDGSLYIPRQLDRNHVCSATLIFPFITAERLALLDQVNDVNLSNWKGLLYFGIPFTNALTEEVAITEQQPSPAIISLNYDSAEGKLQNMMNEKSVQVMPETSISSLELEHKSTPTKTNTNATVNVNNKQRSQRHIESASKRSFEPKETKANLIVGDNKKKQKDSTAKVIIENTDTEKDLNNNNTNREKDSDILEDSSMVLASGASLPVILVKDVEQKNYTNTQQHKHALVNEAQVKIVKSAPVSLNNISTQQHKRTQEGKDAASKYMYLKEQKKELHQELNRHETKYNKLNQDDSNEKTLTSNKTMMLSSLSSSASLTPTEHPNNNNNNINSNSNNLSKHIEEGFALNEYDIDNEDEGVNGEEQLIDKIEHMEGVNEVPVIHAGSKVAALFGGYELPESVTAALGMYSTALETSLMLEERREKELQEEQEEKESKEREVQKKTLSSNTKLEEAKTNNEEEDKHIMNSTTQRKKLEQEENVNYQKKNNLELVQSHENNNNYRVKDNKSSSSSPITTAATAAAVSSPDVVVVHGSQSNNENKNKKTTTSTTMATTASAVKSNKETNTSRHAEDELSKEKYLSTEQEQKHFLSVKNTPAIEHKGVTQEVKEEMHHSKNKIDLQVEPAEKKTAIMKCVEDAEDRGEAMDAYGEVAHAALTMRQKLHVLIYTTEIREDIEENLAQMGHCVTWVITLTRMHRYLVVGLAPFDVLVVDWQRPLIDETVQQLLLHKATKETVVIYHCKVHETKTKPIAKKATPTKVHLSSELESSSSSNATAKKKVLSLTHTQSKSLLSSSTTESSSTTSTSSSSSTSFPIPLSIIGTENVIFNSDLSKTVYESCLLEQTRVFVQQKHLLGSISSVHTRQAYQIVRQVGAGAFGDVFEVHMYASRGRLAMKRVFLKSATLRMLEILNREVTLMSELEHPNIVTFSHVALDDNALSIFMELCDGTLSERIDNPALTMQWNSVKRTENMSFFHPITHTMPLETAPPQRQRQHHEQENHNLASHLSISSLSEHSVKVNKQEERLAAEHSHKSDSTASSRRCSRTQPSLINANMTAQASNTVQHQNHHHHFDDDEDNDENENVNNSSMIKANYAITAREAVLIIHDIASGLAYLHHRDIIHRDIKPENILFLDGVAKIGDFGSAVKVHEKFPLTNMRGTLSYMSPEVLLGEPYGKPCDLWSFGCLIADVMGLNFGHLNGLHVPALIELYKSISLEESLPITLTNRSTSNFENHYSPGTTKEVLEAVKSASYNAAKERSELKSMTLTSRSPTTNTLTTNINARYKKQQESSHLDNLSSAQLHSLEHFPINSNSKQMQLISVHSTPLPPLELDKTTEMKSNDNNDAHEHTNTEMHKPSTINIDNALEKEATKNDLSLKAQMSIPSPTSNKVEKWEAERQETNVVNTELSPKEQLPNVISTSQQVNFALSTPSSDNTYKHHNKEELKARSINIGSDDNSLHNKTEHKLINSEESKAAAIKNENEETDDDDDTAVANGQRTVTCIQTNSISVISTQMARLPSSLVELFEKLFHRNPAKRMNIDELLDHPVA